MKDTIFLVCNRSGIHTMRKTRPALGKGDVAIEVTVIIPPAVFADFIPKFELCVAEEEVRRPDVSLFVETPKEEDEEVAR